MFQTTNQYMIMYLLKIVISIAKRLESQPSWLLTSGNSIDQSEWFFEPITTWFMALGIQQPHSIAK